MATTTTQTKFDFDAYNSVMKGAGAGLKLMLIEQLVEDVEKTCRRFNNPLKKDVSDILDEVTSLRMSWKKQAVLRTQQGPATEIDMRKADTSPHNDGDKAINTVE